MLTANSLVEILYGRISTLAIIALDAPHLINIFIK